MAAKKRTSKKQDPEPRVGLKEKFAEMLELPKEIVMNVPKMIMVGNSDLVIENYKGVIEYEPERIRLNTVTGVVKITGRMLTIREITSEDVMVSGDISTLEFLK